MKEITGYVGRTYTYGGDIRWTIQNEKKFTPPLDLNEKSAKSETQKRIWEKRVDKYVKRDITLQEKYEKLYSLIFGQCIKSMREKLEALNEYEEMMQTFDVIALMKAIKGLTYQFE
jgi:hypothetical protein